MELINEKMKQQTKNKNKKQKINKQWLIFFVLIHFYLIHNTQNQIIIIKTKNKKWWELN